MTFPLKEPLIHVGIVLDSIIEFTLKGDYIWNDEIITPGVYSATLANAKISTQFCLSDLPVKIIPIDERSTFTLKKVKIGLGFHWEQIESQEFEGGITLQSENGKIRIVNDILLENYLKSVISSEMNAMNDINLLNAHAVVSRSWLLAQISSEKVHSQDHSNNKKSEMIFNNEEIIKWYDREDHDTFDVCADDHCQRYQGLTKIISDNAQKAIVATRGLVLISDNNICDTRFSKCCGGITEDFENVWQPVKVSYLVSVPDFISESSKKIKDIKGSFCNTTDPEILSQVLVDFDRSKTNFYRWTVEYSQEIISTLIKKKSGIDFGEIIDLIPIERGNSGRIIRMKIIGSKKTFTVGKELEIRKWLSESHLYSSSFTLEKEYLNNTDIPSKFIIQGAGWGHGVGMCQIGAAMMSKLGYCYNEILNHYYPGAKLEKIY